MRTFVEARVQDEQPTLITERLTLRPFIADDAFDVERLAGMREIADTTLNIPHPYPHGAAAEWIKAHEPAWNDGTSATFAIAAKDTGALLGAISLMIKPEHRRAELGYWIALQFWNRGYATGIDLVLHRFVAVGAIDCRRRLSRPIAERKFGIGQFFVVVQRHRQNWLTVREGVETTTETTTDDYRPGALGGSVDGCGRVFDFGPSEDDAQSAPAAV